MLPRFFGLSGADLAIDLGTANTLIGVVGGGLVPSVVAGEEGTSRILANGAAVGHVARQMLGRTPQSITVVRPLSAGVITDFELCESMLRYFMQKARRRGWGPGPRVVVAVPGRITPVEKRAVFNSAQRAGARQVFLMPQSKAAAIGVGLPISEPVASMICDIGGGTAEIAVLSLGEIVASQSAPLGGDAMDRAITDYMKRRYSLRIGVATAERLRIDIGSAYFLEQELVDEVRGIDTVSGLPRKAVITSEEIREALAAPLAELVDALRATLDECPPDLAADLVDNGLVLSGGGSLLRGLDRFFEEQTGLPTRVDGEALQAVARGVLICLEHLDKWQTALESSDAD